MVVYTQYDADLKQKVFVVRGSERYTNSTICDLEVGYVANHRSYLTLNLTATVQHHLGKSSVAFYDNNNLLGVANISQSQSTAAFSAKVDYGEHNIYAKYLGNAECLSSKSRYADLTVLEPNLPTSTLVVEGFSPQTFTHSTSFSVGLESNDVQLDDKEITIYVDDEWYSTEYSSGSMEIEITDLSNGIHTIKIVFEGDDEYLAAEYENTIWVGYDLDAMVDYQNIVSGNTVTIEAYLHDWGGTPISGERLIVQGFSGYQTTNSDGYAKFELLITNNINRLMVSHSSSNTDEVIPISVVNISSIDMSASDTITALNNDTVVTVIPKLANGNAVPNLLVNINDVDYVTDNNGVVEYVYTGTGAGIATITASNGEVSNSIELEDVIRYWAPSKALNWNYSIVKQLSIAELTNGLQISTPKNGNGQFYFKFDEGKNCDWSLEFKVRYMTIVDEFYGGQFMVCFMDTQKTKWATGTQVKVVKQGNQTQMFIDDVQTRTSTNKVTFIPSIILTNATILITDIKLKRL